LYFPLVDELYTAQRGAGACLNGQPIHTRPPIGRNVSAPSQPLAFFACCSRTHRRYTVNLRYKARILGSTAYTLCLVARGVALLGFEVTPKIWDLAAAWLVVSEAGGEIAAFNGSAPFPLQPRLDYARLSFPTLAAANIELAQAARSQIQPKATP
jgi:myo-inositol-1(or 4)-monophosphatase